MYYFKDERFSEEYIELNSCSFIILNLYGNQGQLEIYHV